MRYIIAIILVVSSGFKGWQLFVNPDSVLPVRYALALVIAAELLFGFTALTGAYWQRMRIVVATGFACFAVFSFYLALSGAESCGCFGPLKVSPWWTFSLDVVVVAGLIAEWWREMPDNMGPSPSLSPEYRGEGLWNVAGICGASLALFLVLVWQTRPVVHADGLLQTANGLTILEPTDWSGQPFPLKESIDVDLSHSEWLVVLYRHDCHDCQEAVPLYEKLARVKRVALVEVPPFAVEAETKGTACAVGRLAADREWFVQTPVEIRLRNGIVVAASTELPAIKSVARHSVSYVDNRWVRSGGLQ